MVLQIKVFKCFGSSEQKPLFRHTICDLPVCFSYETIVESMKLLYGNKCIIQLNII